MIMNRTTIYLGLSILTINVLTSCSHYKSDSEIMSTDSHYATTEVASLSFIASDLKHHQIFTNNLNKFLIILCNKSKLFFFTLSH